MLQYLFWEERSIQNVIYHSRNVLNFNKLIIITCNIRLDFSIQPNKEVIYFKSLTVILILALCKYSDTSYRFLIVELACLFLFQSLYSSFYELPCK